MKYRIQEKDSSGKISECSLKRDLLIKKFVYQWQDFKRMSVIRTDAQEFVGKQD